MAFKGTVIELLIYDANYIGNENGFCSKARKHKMRLQQCAHAEKLTELLKSFCYP
jgi:hypothetical protein